MFLRAIKGARYHSHHSFCTFVHHMNLMGSNDYELYPLPVSYSLQYVHLFRGQLYVDI